MDNYFVIPFTSEDLDQHRDVWFVLLLEIAVEQSRQQLQADPLRGHEVVHIDMRRYRPSKALPTIAEYEIYSQVYFLNEAAMDVCREQSLDISVLKVISEDELPEGLLIYFKEPYLPADQRS